MCQRVDKQRIDQDKGPEMAAGRKQRHVAATKR